MRNDGRLSVDGAEFPGPATVCQCANDTGDSAVANAQVVLTHSHRHTSMQAKSSTCCKRVTGGTKIFINHLKALQ